MTARPPGWLVPVRSIALPSLARREMRLCMDKRGSAFVTVGGTLRTDIELSPSTCGRAIAIFDWREREGWVAVFDGALAAETCAIYPLPDCGVRLERCG